ncbi:hypothetical protein BIW11_04355 [Tropilaelaps mercedesae]|uniref:Uncharacterized protein n=1 Tax=Tropilaelaps mercedesae TaxID=418985 RepID=A0A1V9X7N5_9ACAR|nr:hypothetical protein BIW11_04355 [Tropilaelaps mercedesae]
MFYANATPHRVCQTERYSTSCMRRALPPAWLTAEVTTVLHFTCTTVRTAWRAVVHMCTPAYNRDVLSSRPVLYSVGLRHHDAMRPIPFRRMALAIDCCLLDPCSPFPTPTSCENHDRAAVTVTAGRPVDGVGAVGETKFVIASSDFGPQVERWPDDRSSYANSPAGVSTFMEDVRLLFMSLVFHRGLCDCLTRRSLCAGEKLVPRSTNISKRVAGLFTGAMCPVIVWSDCTVRRL